MNINGFHLHFTNDDIGKLVLRYAKDAIDSVTLHDGSVTIRGRRDGFKNGDYVLSGLAVVRSSMI